MAHFEEWWSGFAKVFSVRHPRVKKPAAFYQAENAWVEKALVPLVTKDGYRPEEVTRALSWVFESGNRDAVFWQQQVMSLAALRKRKDGVHKFDRIFSKWSSVTNYTPDMPKGVDETQPFKPSWAKDPF